MDSLEATLLGLVQGATEFLPVSSSGHLLIFYRRRVTELAVGSLRASPDALRYVAKLGLATLPAVAVALVARRFVEQLFESPASVGAALVVTGVLLITTRRTVGRASRSEPGWGAALAIGCAQALAIAPGVSRSGATVAVALALGVAPTAAAEFSFLMSVVAILGAVALQLSELESVSPGLWSGIAVGGAVALLSGLAALWLFVRLLRGGSFHRFAYYTWALGGSVLAWQLLGA
jgi:undecaprenyl-diphosphatase